MLQVLETEFVVSDKEKLGQVISEGDCQRAERK
jgi:hypothetical protein